MFCSSCGSENTGGVRFCGACGKPTDASSSKTDVSYVQYMPFGTAIATCLSKYAVFHGRASRSEYWWFFLFTVLLSWGADIVDSVIGGSLVLAIVNLALFLPSISSLVRRLHDINRSGYWYWVLLTIVGIPILIYWLCKKSDPIKNEYG
jgi:uncharacterized membrane protein YhaH (DUF805 family)